MKINENFVNFYKMKVLLIAEKMTLMNHPDGMPFLGLFLREYERDPEEALSYFSRKSQNGSNPRKMISELDLSNIKNEVITAICLYLLNTRVYRKDDSQYSMETIMAKVPNYDINDKCNKKILVPNPLSLDISDNPDAVNTIFNNYLLETPDTVSEYIDGYLQTMIAILDSGISTPDMEAANVWNQARIYSAKEVKFLKDTLRGKNKPLLPPKTRAKNVKKEK